uniref:Chromosomal replication initiator protein DnaA n=1 Tax=Lygus hesperus TaxID=30085 RepID=A0A0A9XQ38_LYGHE
MSFFATETIPSRVEAKQTIDYRNDNAMLQRDFTIGGQSGFQKSPYELFRANVAKYCERYMMDSFASHDCMSAEEKASIAYRNSPGCVCNRDNKESTQNHNVNHKISRVFEVINDISRDPSSTTNDTNAFSVLSISFEPSGTDESNKKMSILERISKLMNHYSTLIKCHSRSMRS